MIEKGVEVTFKPNWINKNIINSDNFNKIMYFFVVRTPAKNVSSQGYKFSSPEWENYKLTSSELREYMLGVANLKRDENFFVIHHVDDFKDVPKTVNLGKDFNKHLSEKVAIYVSNNKSILESLFYHIRCALAHGRFAIKVKNGETYYLFESVKSSKVDDKYYLRSRMVLKESTLIKWIDVIFTGEI